MTQPTAEAYEATDELALYIDRVLDTSAWAETGAEVATHIRDVLGYRPYAAAVAEGRRLEAEKLAPLVEAVKALRRGRGDGGTNRLLAVFAAVDALTREDTEGRP